VLLYDYIMYLHYEITLNLSVYDQSFLINILNVNIKYKASVSAFVAIPAAIQPTIDCRPAIHGYRRPAGYPRRILFTPYRCRSER